MREWSIGGDFGLPKRESNNNNDRGRKDIDQSFSRRGSIVDLSPNDIDTFESLIEQRPQAKKNRDVDTADSIRDQLDQEFNVKVDEKSMYNSTSSMRLFRNK
jgi:cysteinyl-tRNA synthetase